MCVVATVRFIWRIKTWPFSKSSPNMQLPKFVLLDTPIIYIYIWIYIYLLRFDGVSAEPPTSISVDVGVDRVWQTCSCPVRDLRYIRLYLMIRRINTKQAAAAASSLLSSAHQIFRIET